MSDNRIIGEFVSAAEPTADELNRLAAFFEKKLNSPVTLKWVEDKSVAKGFILKVLNEVYENTPEGLIKSLKTAVADVRKSDGDYISLVKSAIANWQPKATAEEIGDVVSVADGVARVEGLHGVRYGEILEFEGGEKGMLSTSAKTKPVAFCSTATT